MGRGGRLSYDVYLAPSIPTAIDDRPPGLAQRMWSHPGDDRGSGEEEERAADADRLGLVADDTATLTTKRASVMVTVAVDDTVQPGHVSLPNGLGLDHVESGARHQTGVAPNELTASEDRDPWAGTPWHKTVPARLERVPA